MTTKGVVAVAVQAAQIDEKILNAWVQKSNVGIPVGTIQIDPDEIKSIWGVRALPWLVLTDSKHIVRAEGFSITELNDRLK